MNKDARPRVVALYDYEAPVEVRDLLCDTPLIAHVQGELSFKGGNVILVNIKDESGWWQGQLGDHVGWFPGARDLCVSVR
jgi:hypothetical protein